MDYFKVAFSWINFGKITLLVRLELNWRDCINGCSLLLFDYVPMKILNSFGIYVLADVSSVMSLLTS